VLAVVRGGTPLMAAAYVGNASAARLLLDHGTKVDTKNFFGKTALDLATIGGKKDVADLLRSHGAKTAAPAAEIPTVLVPPKTITAEEKQAWLQVDSLSRESLDGFLKQFPSGQLAEQARFALELQDRFAAIRRGTFKPQAIIPVSVFGDRWQSWKQRKPGKGVTGYSANRSGTLGVFFDPPLSGGKTGGVDSISFDSGGVPAS
jgi:hypothetical protein